MWCACGGDPAPRGRGHPPRGRRVRRQARLARRPRGRALPAGVPRARPGALEAGEAVLELELTATEDVGALRGHFAFVDDLDAYARPEFLRAAGGSVKSSVVAFSTRFTLPADAGGRVLVGANGPARVLVDGVEVGRQAALAADLDAVDEHAGRAVRPHQHLGRGRVRGERDAGRERDDRALGARARGAQELGARVALEVVDECEVRRAARARPRSPSGAARARSRRRQARPGPRPGSRRRRVRPRGRRARRAWRRSRRPRGGCATRARSRSPPAPAPHRPAATAPQSRNSSGTRPLPPR